MSATATAHGLHVLAGATVLGSVGLLVGARLDFGQLGIATLADLCGIELPSGLDTLRYRAASAPWTYVCMLVGCNLAMLLAGRSGEYVHPAGPLRVLRFLACNAGMILGMCLAELLLPAPLFGSEDLPATARMLLLMVPGMVAGMWVGWWCVEWMLRARQRGHPDFALRHGPRRVSPNPGAAGRRSGCDGNR